MSYAETAQGVLEDLIEAAEEGTYACTITRTTPPARGSADAAVVETATGVGLIFDYESRDSGTSSHGATLILANDKRLYLAALAADGTAIALTPKKGDKITAPDGLKYNVENVKRVGPSGVVVLFDIQLRDGVAAPTHGPALLTESGALLTTEDGSAILLES